MSIRAVATFILCLCLMAPGAGGAMATNDTTDLDGMPAIVDASPTQPAGGCHHGVPSSETDSDTQQADGDRTPAATPCCGNCDCGCPPAAPATLASALASAPVPTGSARLRTGSIASFTIDPPLRPPIS